MLFQLRLLVLFCGFGAIATHTDTRVAQHKKINLINYPQKYLCAGWFGGSIETV